MILIGLARLGRDAELRKTPAGDSVANLALAFNYGRNGDDGKTPTQWVDAALYGKRADALAEYLVKGQQVLVQLDDPHVHTFKKKDGTEGAVLKGFVSKIEFAGPKPEAKPAAKPAAKQAGNSFDDMDDDLPWKS